MERYLTDWFTFNSVVPYRPPMLEFDFPLLAKPLKERSGTYPRCHNPLVPLNEAPDVIIFDNCQIKISEISYTNQLVDYDNRQRIMPGTLI